VNYEKLAPTIAKWADAFSNLKFTKDDVRREMKAVTSEYQNTLVSDAWRFQELVRRLSNPDAQFIRCSIGNMDSLPVDSQEVDVYSEAKQFFDQYYTPERMSIVIVGAQSLDDLELLAQTNFGSIKRQHRELPVAGLPTFTPAFLGKFAWVKTISHGQAIRLVFPLSKHLL